MAVKSPYAPPLKLTDLSVSFGGIHAIDGVSLEVEPGETLGLIGPNGAGKTTLLNLIGGQATADSGRIVLGEDDVTRWPVHRRARQGLVRSFQVTNVFPELTVEQNVTMAASAVRKRHYRVLRRPDEDAIAEAADGALAATGLEATRTVRASALGHGQARALEVAMLVAAGGRILLLDEPAAGLAAGEVGHMIETIQRIQADSRASLVIVEHKLAVIFNLCQRIAVLDRGKLLAVGLPEEIAADPAVRSAYLGEEIDVA